MRRHYRGISQAGVWLLQTNPSHVLNGNTASEKAMFYMVTWFCFGARCRLARGIPVLCAARFKDVRAFNACATIVRLRNLRFHHPGANLLPHSYDRYRNI